MTTDLEITVTEGGGPWSKVPIGYYPATITAITTEGAEGKPFISTFEGKESAQIMFGFTLEGMTDEEGAPLTLNRYVTQTLGPNSNLRMIAEACGFSLEVGVPFKVAQLMGKRCQVGIEQKRDITKKLKWNEDGTPMTGISKAAPLPQGAAPATPAASKATFAATPPPPGPTTTAGTDVCTVVMCGGDVDHYTKNGTALCVSHTAEDL